MTADDQPSLWQDHVMLDEDFFRALSDHPVPLSESALRAIGPRSMVIEDLTAEGCFAEATRGTRMTEMGR